MRQLGNPVMAVQERGRLGSHGCLGKTFTLSIGDARAKAREILREQPAGGSMTIVENWWQLPNGQIQFTMSHLPTAD